MATVAIIGILIAIAIPSAVVIQRNLKQLELDGAARAIFFAAQNRLTALQAADGLEQVQKDAPPAPGDDFPETVGVISYADNMGGGDALFRLVLPEHAVDDTPFGKGRTVIEYNADSGSVYAVFYAEGEFTYDAGIPRDKADCKQHDPMLGYYGGDAVTRPELGELPQPSLTLVNDEELRLVVDYGGVSADADLLASLQYTVKLVQADEENNTVTLDANTLMPGSFDSSDKAELVLDRLTGPHFVDVSKGALDPGADFYATLTITYRGTDETVYRPVTVRSNTENSLFAARGAYTPAGETASLDDAVQVSLGRHLQNLEPRISGLGKGPADRSVGTADKYQPKNVVLTGQIDWAVYKDAQVTACGAASIGPEGQTVTPDSFKKGGFLSIKNDNIKLVHGEAGTLRNLDILYNDRNVGAADSAGLFATLTDATVRHVSLVNAKLEDSAQYIGLLAGQLTNTDLTDCRVYLDGTAAKTPEKYGVSTPRNGPGTIVGGLVGVMTGGSAEGCFAAPGLVSAPEGSAGGLFGQVLGTAGTGTGAKISNCYASATVKGATCGGFARTLGYVHLKNCYAVGTLDGDASGFAYATKAETNMVACYAAATYVGNYVEYSDTPFTGSKGTYTNCNYVVDIVNGPTAATENVDGVAPISYQEMTEKKATYGGTNGVWRGSSVKTTNPYSMKPYADLGDLREKTDDTLYSDKVYPFPRLAELPHYGDWPLPEVMVNGGLVYYEVYDDGTLGMNGLSADGTALELETEKPLLDKMIARDGYAWVTGGASETVSILSGMSPNETSLSLDDALSALVGMSAYPFPGELLTKAPPPAGKFGVPITKVAGRSVSRLYFNPQFADTVSAEDITTPAFRVRSARQLTAIGVNAQYWADGFTFTQELDVDYDKYDAAYLALKPLITPIGDDQYNLDRLFRGTYDGGYHTIVHPGMKTNNHAGLFGAVGSSGTLKNIVLRANKKGAVFAGGTFYPASVGALAGVNQGTITNCASSGFKVGYRVGPSSTNVGGLVGLNSTSATISNCAAASVEVSYGINVGGLVGQNSAGKIDRSYAVGKISKQNDGSYLGGIAGLSVYSGTSSNCISACENDTNLMAAITGGSSDIKATNCYYLREAAPKAYGPAAGRGTSMTYEGLMKLTLEGFGKTTAEHTYPFDNDDNEAYPFPTSVTNADGQPVHYGDWPLPKKVKDGGLVYYEVYEDGSFGMNGLAADGTALDLEKPLQTKMVVRDGYAWVSGGSEPFATIQESDMGTTEMLLARDETLSNYAEVSVYPLAGKTLMDTQPPKEQNGIQIRKVSGQETSLYFNPQFGNSVSAEPIQTDFLIRSARQLAALGKYDRYWAKGITFTQELDVDYGTYDTTYLEDKLPTLPIGDMDQDTAIERPRRFYGTYDGGCHVITHPGMTTTNHAGLFGVVDTVGVLKNIVLRAAPLGAVIAGDNNGSASVGALVGVNFGTITNCAAAGFTVGSRSVNAGGLVGLNRSSGKIKNCAASSVSVSQAAYVGGLVGYNNGGTIQGSYALGKISGKGLDTGGIAGRNDWGNVPKINDCISACENDTENMIAVAPNTIKNCYYLTDAAPNAHVEKATTSIGKSYDELMKLSLSGFVKATNDHTYPFKSNGAYPFPTSVTNAAGEPVHYGDWPGRKFGTLAIGVAVKRPINWSNKTTTYDVWGVDQSGTWSDKFIDTFTVSIAETDKHVLLCLPTGMPAGAWSVQNSSMPKQVLISTLNRYLESGDNTMKKYDLYYGDYSADTWAWGKTNYFYETPEMGPSTSWSFSITNPPDQNFGGTPIFKQNN